jgi:hypothetical protein
MNRSHLRRRALDTGRSVGLRLRRRLTGAALVRSLALKAVKLPVHGVIWSLAALLGQLETVVARERSIFVTAGILADAFSSRRAPARARAAEEPEERDDRAEARARG